MTPEAKVKKQIKDYLNSIGAYHFWPVQMGMGSPTLDCLACIDGRFVAIEVKKPGTVSATPRQNSTIRKIGESKGLAFVTDSLERAKKIIESLGEGVDLHSSGARLGRRERRIYEIIKNCPGGVDIDSICERLYSGDEDCETSPVTVRVQICQINKKLPDEQIRCHEWCGGKRSTTGLYKIVPRSQE